MALLSSGGSRTSVQMSRSSELTKEKLARIFMGALKNTIDDHGPIGKDRLESAWKRFWGQYQSACREIQPGLTPLKVRSVNGQRWTRRGRRNARKAGQPGDPEMPLARKRSEVGDAEHPTP